MRATFIEAFGFTEWVSEFLSDEALADLQVLLLMATPDAGDVIPGCGGLRKIRVADSRRAKGKRGGIRVIYLYVPEAKWFLLIDAYNKDEKDDLTADEKGLLAQLASQFKQEAIAATSQGRRKTR